MILIRDASLAANDATLAHQPCAGFGNIPNINPL
jgi:hypothetical protein